MTSGNLIFFPTFLIPMSFMSAFLIVYTPYQFHRESKILAVYVYGNDFHLCSESIKLYLNFIDHNTKAKHIFFVNLRSYRKTYFMPSLKWPFSSFHQITLVSENKLKSCSNQMNNVLSIVKLLYSE